MIINPRTIIENGWVKFPNEDIDLEKYIQPNAIDFTIDALFQLNDTVFQISEDYKRHRGVQPVNIQKFYNSKLDKGWQIFRGAYDFMSDVYVEVPEGHVAWLVARSTFVRNGMFIVSGLYDSGFKGPIGGMLHNRSTEAWVAPGTRVGQIIFSDSQTAKQYAGGYNTAQGEHWAGK